MSDNSSVYSIAIVLLILNIVTPIFAYALTDLTIDQDYAEDIPFFDQDDLVSSGIYLEYAERGLLTYQGTPDYVTFETNLSRPFRVRWYDAGPVGYSGTFNFYSKLWGEIFGTWLYGKFHDVVIDGVRYDRIDDPPTNLTILGAFNPAYNWTRVTVPEPGYELFFTAEAYDNNMSLALETGILNVTLGVPVDFKNYDASNFISWYWGLMDGTESYGIPPYVAWVFRLQALLLVFSGIIIARDLIGFT